jgi:hypothetical protein
MPDKRAKLGPSDHARIKLESDDDVRFWCREFGITRKQLMTVVAKVGDGPKDVKQELARKAPPVPPIRDANRARVRDTTDDPFGPGKDREDG